MPRRVMGIGVIAWSLVLAVQLPQANGEDISQQVAAEAQRLDHWLGRTANGNRWRAYLNWNVLQQQLRQGSQADLESVAKLVAIYAAIPPTKNSPQLTAMRQALESWLEELTHPQSGELADVARASKTKFTANVEQQLANEKAELEAANRELSTYLTQLPAPQRSDWEQTLRWSDLQTQLTADEPELEHLQQVLQQFRDNRQGLELRPFARMRQALRRFLRTSQVAREGMTPERFAERLDDLATQLETYSKEPSGEAASAIGSTLGWLQDAGQVPRLVEAVRRRYALPNLYADLSADFLSAGLADHIYESTYVNENILGTQLKGVATMNGQLQVALVPSPQVAVLDLQLFGNAYSNNRGYNGPVTLSTTGVTSVSAAKRVYIDADGIKAGPVGARCATASQIHDINAKCGLVERIAWKRARAQQNQSQQIASRRAEGRIASRMEYRAGPLLQQANASFVEKFRQPLVRRDAYPDALNFSTSADRLEVRALQAKATQIGAPNQPPSLANSYDINLRVHESLVSNFSEQLVGGMTLTDERLAEVIKEMSGEVPEELQIGPDKDPWSITFMADRPVSVHFSGNTLQIRIRGRRFTRNDQEIRNSIQISATYRLADPSASAPVFAREGEVAVDFLNRERLGITQVAFKTFLRKKFEALFKPEIAAEGLQMPGRWEQFGRLPLRHAQADAGWLTMAWHRGTSAAGAIQPATAQIAPDPASTAANP